MAKVIDANVIIRYLVGDSPLQTQRFKKIIQAEKEKYFLTDVTIAEIIWVLQSYYKQEKDKICDEILSLLEVAVFMVNKSLITRAVNYFRQYNLDYIDAYLIAFSQEENAEGVLSFDKSIDKVKEIKRFEP